MNNTSIPSRSRRQWEAEARIRVTKGESGSSVEADFVKQGLDSQSAKTIADEAVANARSRATRLLIGSTAFAGLGLFVTVASYSAATSNPYGGPYWIWYGPIIAGGIAALVALGRLLNVRR
ncbi:MAG: hypothetical protein WBC59_03415 [Phycisphaerae bacterium]